MGLREPTGNQARGNSQLPWQARRPAAGHGVDGASRADRHRGPESWRHTHDDTAECTSQAARAIAQLSRLPQLLPPSQLISSQTIPQCKAVGRVHGCSTACGWSRDKAVALTWERVSGCRPGLRLGQAGTAQLPPAQPHVLHRGRHPRPPPQRCSSREGQAKGHQRLSVCPRSSTGWEPPQTASPFPYGKPHGSSPKEQLPAGVACILHDQLR